MRKILLTLTLLIFGACASNQSLVQSNKIYTGMSKDQLRKTLLWDSSLGDDAFLSSGFKAYYPDKNMEILAGSNKQIFYVFNNVTIPVSGLGSYGNGTLLSHHWNYQSAMNAINPKIETVINKPAEKVIEATKPKLTEEQIKISKMKPEDRHAYTCNEKFGFRKGSNKFKDCVFEMYKAETELEKLELQKQVAKANADAARANAEAARAGAERQERLALAQTEAAKMQALASRQQAIAANTADSLALIESGLRMMSPQRPAPRMQTSCTYVGRFLNCF